MRSVVIIPAYNEESSIGLVLDEIPSPFRSRVIVADNQSSDQTKRVAEEHGAQVISASPKGYGAACLAGIHKAKEDPPEIFIFLDADYSDHPQDMTRLVSHLQKENLDLVIGSRTLGWAEPGSLLPQARFGNWLATRLMAWRFGYRFTDLGPFRVIRASALDQLQMKDKNFGWTIEMQVKALQFNLRVGEIPVHYKKRVGVSKITGTISGTFKAGLKILYTLGRYSFFSSS